MLYMLIYFGLFYFQKRLEENKQKLVGITSHLYKLSKERRSSWIIDTDSASDLLTKRQKDALGMQNGIDASNGDKDGYSYQEPSTAVLMGSSIPVKNAVRPIKLTEVKKLPPYTTWIFLDRFVRVTRILVSFFLCHVFLHSLFIYRTSVRKKCNGKAYFPPKGRRRFEPWRRCCWEGQSQTPNMNRKTDMENTKKN